MCLKVVDTRHVSREHIEEILNLAHVWAVVKPYRRSKCDKVVDLVVQATLSCLGRTQAS